MYWYIVLRAIRPYGVSKLNSVKSAPVAARLSPLVKAPERKYINKIACYRKNEPTMVKQRKNAVIGK